MALRITIDAEAWVLGAMRSCAKYFLLSLGLFTLSSVQGQIRINEILAGNSTTIHDPDFGEFPDFIELRNTSTEPATLAGLRLSDRQDGSNAWVLPSIILAPGQHLLVWADDRDKRPGDTAFVAYRNGVATMTSSHADFKLSGDGEYVGLFDAAGNVVDEFSFGVQTDDVSMGIDPNNPTQWQYFSEPTPGFANSPYGSVLLQAASEPMFSLPGGIYPSAQSLQLTTEESNATIRYTYDGSNPNGNSPIYSTSIPLNLSLAIKARVYVPGMMPSKVVTMTYLINENDQFPIISISASSTNLYDVDFGILQNAIKDREVPATITYFEQGEQTPAFTAGVGLRVFGSSIYNLPQRPLSVRFKEKYGTEVLSYQLFPDKPITQYSSFQLRNGGNDYSTAFFRDGLGATLVKGKIDIDYQDYRPCLVFINGTYSGIHELRERLDERYIASNHDVNADNLDYLEDSLQVVAGDQHAYQELLGFVANNDLADPANYANVAAQVDVDELLNFLILRAFIGYQIGDLNNRYWRDRDATGDQKWRWIATDLEHAFGQLGGDPVEANTIAKLAGLAGDLPDWSTVLFNRLLLNASFRDEFVQRSAAYTNTIFDPTVTTAAVDSLKNLFLPQMPRHIGRWGSPPSMPIWQSNIDQIISFLQERPAYYRQHIMDLFSVEDGANVNMQIVGQGEVMVSGAKFSGEMNAPFFKHAAISLQAIPAPGHRFVMWQGIDGDLAETSLVPVGDTSFVAVFAAQDNISIIPPLVAQDTTLAAAASPWYGFEDVVIMPGARLTVEAGATLLLTDGICFDVQGGIALNGTSDAHINVLSDPSPSARRSFVGQAGHWGSIMADTPSDSVIIRYSDLRQGSYGRDRDLHPSTISTYSSKLLIEHATISGGKAPLIARDGSAHIAHSEFHTYSSANGFISLYDMEGPIIEHCQFNGNRASNTDAIDLKRVTNGIVRHNHIRDFLGSNCDGIDLGIYSLNTVLEHNIIHDCTDKGISIGSQSNAIIYRNLIHDCDLGVALKDSLSVAQIDQNTLYGNRIGVACYEKSTLRGGGTAFVKNTILSASIDSSISYDIHSTIEVSYSLSDREALAGIGNLNTDALLVHPSTGNFELQPGSPCIDSGDPTSPLDNDGSLADRGAYYTHTGAHGLTVHINECNYHSSEFYEQGDWIELKNRTDHAVDISGWRITHGLHAFTLPPNTAMAPGAHLVLCQEMQRFDQLHPDVSNIIGDFHFDLSNSAGKIGLHDNTGLLVHSMRYADHRPWPPLADGRGATVELHQGVEGNSPTDWRESHVLMGTPGAPNSSALDVSGLYVNEVMASNTTTIADENGEFDDWIELYNASDIPLNVGGLCITDEIERPYRWQLALDAPERTTIPAQGYLLLWADDDTEQGVLHTNFKLSASGETLTIHQRNGSGYAERERFEFGEQVTDVSFGRYPDGSAVLQTMQPTPGGTNLATLLAELERGGLEVHPNPFADQLIVVTKPIMKPYRLIVQDMTGRVVVEKHALTDNVLGIDRNALAPGPYSISIIDAHGRVHTAKAIAQ